MKENCCAIHVSRLYWYNVKRPHFGEDMNRKPPFEKLKEFYPNLPEQFALLPPIILDDISTFWQVRGGNDLLTAYTSPGLTRFPQWAFAFWSVLGASS